MERGEVYVRMRMRMRRNKKESRGEYLNMYLDSSKGAMRE